MYTKKWKKILKLRDMTPTAVTGYDLVSIIKGKTWSKFMYHHLINKICVNNHLAKAKWEAERWKLMIRSGIIRLVISRSSHSPQGYDICNIEFNLEH